MWEQRVSSTRVTHETQELSISTPNFVQYLESSVETTERAVAQKKEKRKLNVGKIGHDRKYNELLDSTWSKTHTHHMFEKHVLSKITESHAAFDVLL